MWTKDWRGLSIKEDAIRYYDGKPKLCYTTSKTKKGAVEVEKPINDLVIEVILDLISFTETARKLCGTKHVFVAYKNSSYGYIRNKKQLEYVLENKWKLETVIIQKNNINRDFILPFIRRNDIKQDGEFIEYTTHYNRHFFAQLAWLNNLSVQSIKEMMNHDSYNMTEVYTYNAESAMREKFKKMMSNPKYMVGISADKYKKQLEDKNLFIGRTEEQLDAIVSAMNIQILSNGACLHHPLRSDERLSKCMPGCHKCERYVTHKEYISVHILRVNRLLSEMEKAEKMKNLNWYNKCKVEKEFIENNYIKPFDEN